MKALVARGEPAWRRGARTILLLPATLVNASRSPMRGIPVDAG